MKVLLDCRMARWTGVGRYTTGLVRALSRRDDLELVLLTAEGDPPLVDSDRAQHGVLGEASVLAARHDGVWQVAGAVRPDVTHCLHFPTPLPMRKPLVVTLHDLTPLLIEGVMESSVKRAAYTRLNARAVRLANGIITPSASTANDVVRGFPGADGKTRVVPEAADDFSAGEIGSLAATRCRPGGGPLCALDGLHSAAQGSVHAHRGVRARRATTTRLRLVLVGAEVPGFVAGVLGARPVIADRVVWTGRVSDAELRALYAGAAVFAFPSRYEGFGLPPLEAMAMGAPVVASDASSLPEVVADAGILVPSGQPQALSEALTRVLEDAGLRERLVAAGAAPRR